MLPALVTGSALGSIYALVAAGYNLTWLTGRVINFAQAAFMVSGMFITVWLYNRGVPAVAVIAILACIGALVAAVEYLVAIWPLQGRGGHNELVTTVGVTTVIEGVILLLVIEDSLRVPFFGPTHLIDLPGGRVAPVEFVLIALALLLCYGAHWWATRTRPGLAALAQAEDRDAALILGLRPGRIAFLGFMTSGVIGFAIAPIVGAMTFAAVGLMALLAVKGFVALAIGGVGSFVGCLVGGVGIGVVESLVSHLADAEYQNLAIFAVFLCALLLRPQGLFGRTRERIV